MFAHLRALIQLRRSTAFLLSPAQARLLDDIGLSYNELMELRRGGRLSRPAAQRRPAVTAFVRDIPVAGRM